MHGIFITIEGMDGAGKSTHVPQMIDFLSAQGREVVSTREPGGTVLGERLREILLHEAMHAETETLLMFAARREHLAQVILPALARGAMVLSDRFTDATYAYQSGAKGVLTEKVASLETWVQGNLQPDLTLIFDVPVEVSLARLASARTPDKFEREQTPFFHALRETYLARAKADPKRCKIIQSNQSLELVKAEVKTVLQTFMASV